MSVKEARAWDPLYGRLKLDEFEALIAFSPEIQRLRYIRMCNINSLLILGASEISRFEHTLGVLRLTQEWIRTHEVSNKDAFLLKAAALLHDFQTAPFGHSLQYVLEDQETRGPEFKHEDLSAGRESQFYQRLTAGASFAGYPFELHSRLGPDWEEIVSLVRGEGELGPLISSDLDLDNIDNVFRLAYHVGIATSHDGERALRLARSLAIDDGLILEKKSLPDLERWATVRARLYELLLEDSWEFSAKAMLTRAIEEALASELLGADSWLLTDDELLALLQEQSIGADQHVGDLVKRLRVGNLYRPVSIVTLKETELYSHFATLDKKKSKEAALALQPTTEERLKGSVEEKVSNNKGRGLGASIILHPILDIGKTTRQISFKLCGSPRTISIGQDSKRLLLGLFSSSDLSPAKEGKLRREFFNLLDRLGAGKVSEIQDPIQEQRSLQRQLELV